MYHKQKKDVHSRILKMGYFWLTVASPFAGLPCFLGNRMSLDLYSLSLWTFCCSDSMDRFLRLWSTAIPIHKACFLKTPAAWREKHQVQHPTIFQWSVSLQRKFPQILSIDWIIWAQLTLVLGWLKHTLGSSNSLDTLFFFPTIKISTTSWSMMW